jgi:hypothetical protein
VRAEVEDLYQSVNKGRDATKLAFRGLPSDDAMLRRRWLQFMMGKWKGEYVAAHPCGNPGHFAPVHEQVPVPGLGADTLGRIGDVVGNFGAACHTGGQHPHRSQCDHAPSHALTAGNSSSQSSGASSSALGKRPKSPPVCRKTMRSPKTCGFFFS